MNPRADPVLAEATDGTPAAFDKPAPGFSLVDQYGRPVLAQQPARYALTDEAIRRGTLRWPP
ncbi:MAG: hypothetical protein ABSA91_13720 [Acidimicrobiales bacterium]